jgi:hypothetical protein
MRRTQRSFTGWPVCGNGRSRNIYISSAVATRPADASARAALVFLTADITTDRHTCLPKSGKMMLSISLFALLLALAWGQSTQECTREVAATDECADVINPNACYNQFKFGSARTLQCIDGKNDEDRKKKVRRGFGL